MNYDFGGYATKNDLKCSDGRVIRRDAFKNCNGMEVPLVYQHVHSNPMNIIGHATLENREDGVYAYCSLNDSESGKHMKEVVKHGDVKALSIYANRLQQHGSDVVHGIIREVSVVLAGANPGAMIENVSFAHADGTEWESEDDVIIRSESPLEYLEHADDDNSSDQNGSFDNGSSSSSDDKTVGEIYDAMSDQKKALVDYMIAVALEGGVDEEEISTTSQQVQHADDGPTVQDVWDSFTEEERTAAEYMIGQAVESAKDENEAEENIEKLEDEMTHSDQGDDYMYQSVFKQDNVEPTVSLTHSDMEVIVENAKKGNGSLKEAIYDFIQHNFGGIDSDDPAEVLQHGIENMEILFPEAKLASANPELISRPMDWVAEVWNATKKTPFARIKSIAANITADEARARGYIKGKKKIEEVVKLLKRVTTPQTVYKLQKLDRDDVIDATELDAVAWLKQEMRMMLEEELSRAVLIGDGRESTDESKINEDNIRPIATEADLFAIKYDVTIPADADRLAKSDAVVDAAILSREDYMGSGAPVLYAPLSTINTALLARDKVGHRLYRTVSELADAMNVSKIVEVPVMKGFQITDENKKKYNLLGIIVNLKDYSVGADKGGAVTLFDDFDLNYNKYEYLIETRCSGALTKPYSAIVLRELVTTTPPSPDTETDNQSISG